MTGRDAWRAGFVFGLMLLGGCGHHHAFEADNGNEAEINAYPANYKSDILAAMHSYLNDPTGIRDAAISQPVLKSTGTVTRYMLCLQFNPKKNAHEYAGVKEVAAFFLVGRFDHFVETLHDECAGAAYTPFPELQKLPP
jgi:hypothetical protein